MLDRPYWNDELACIVEAGHSGPDKLVRAFLWIPEEWISLIHPANKWFFTPAKDPPNRTWALRGKNTRYQKMRFYLESLQNNGKFPITLKPSCQSATRAPWMLGISLPRWPTPGKWFFTLYGLKAGDILLLLVVFALTLADPALKRPRVRASEKIFSWGVPGERFFMNGKNNSCFEILPSDRIRNEECRPFFHTQISETSYNGRIRLIFAWSACSKQKDFMSFGNKSGGSQFLFI